MARKKKEIIPETDIHYFDKKGATLVAKKYQVLNEFLFKRLNFYLVGKNGYFAVCYPYEGRLFSIWAPKEKVMLASEAANQFREGFEKNNLEEKDIEAFIREPLKYIRQREKKTKNGQKRNN